MDAQNSEHSDIYANLRDIKDSLTKLLQTLNTMSINAALGDQEIKQISSSVISIQQDVKRINLALYGDLSVTGLIAQVARHDNELGGLKKVVWLLVGSLVTGVGAFFASRMLMP